MVSIFSDVIFSKTWILIHFSRLEYPEEMKLKIEVRKLMAQYEEVRFVDSLSARILSTNTPLNLVTQRSMSSTRSEEANAKRD